MTTEQKYHRRLARKYGALAAQQARREDDSDYRGVGSPFDFASRAAWHAFKTHPELREIA